MRERWALCLIIGCAQPGGTAPPEPTTPPRITSFTATPIGGLGATTYHLAWAITAGSDGSRCALDVDGSGAFTEVACADGALDHDYARGVYEADLVVDDF